MGSDGFDKHALFRISISIRSLLGGMAKKSFNSRLRDVTLALFLWQWKETDRKLELITVLWVENQLATRTAEAYAFSTRREGSIVVRAAVTLVRQDLATKAGVLFVLNLHHPLSTVRRNLWCIFPFAVPFFM